jgi:hypothetical protein
MMPPFALTPPPVPASFRDPAGFVFVEDGVHKRAITRSGLPAYTQFLESGLYDELAANALILPHREQALAHPNAVVRKVLIPEQLAYVSYPYEWCFSQLRDAALLTLDIQRRALRKGMSLKDASAFNVQFRGAASPVFIDTLSFEENDGGPWVAYHQFCRQFLGPLLLAAYRDEDFLAHLAAQPEGYPLEFTSRLLPLRSYLRPGPLLHIHLHSRAGAAEAGREPAARAPQQSAKPSADRKPQLTESLHAAITAIQLRPRRSAWSGYYEDRTHYTEQAESFRRQTVLRHLERLKPSLVYDLGANRGDYSRLIAATGYRCVALEMDSRCVEASYRAARELQDPEAWLLPLRMNLCAPSPGLGFACSERMSLAERPRAGLIVALALIHHLRIGGQAPLDRIASYLGQLGDHLLIEFVPADDPMVRRMLRNHTNAFEDYTLQNFRDASTPYWEEMESHAIPDSPRSLHLFRKRA